MSDSLPDFMQPLLRLDGMYPFEAVAETLERRDESVPVLLRALEQQLGPNRPSKADRDYMLDTFALFILGYLEEKRAKNLALALARHPEVDDLLGDVVTSGLAGILANLFADAPEELHPFIEDQDAEEYARSAGLQALGILHRANRLDRATLSNYLAQLYADKLEREPCNVWDMAISISACFAMAEHRDAIRAAYQNGYADEFYDTLDEVEVALDSKSADPSRIDEFSPLSHPDDELANWACFTEDHTDEGELDDDKPYWATMLDDDAPKPSSAPKHSRVPDPASIIASGATFRHEQPKVGRNDPCPCGSGKKYKKCCGS